jgi:alpha-galactosidase
MNTRAWLAGILSAVTALHALAQPAPTNPAFWRWAERPPLGWNSWDCFATTVTEAQTKAQADVMAEKLKPHGWEYIVVDIQWYEPNATGFDYRKGAALTMDEWGRLWPATNRFPSAVGGAGFKPLADYVHGKGLKFGIHLMRGIPRQAVRLNTPIKGTSFHAAEIADTNHVCEWNTDMFGVNMTRPGAQEYYDSVFALIAAWEVDFVKVDDLSRPYPRNSPEIEAIRKAIDRTGRPMVLSLSPGETPVVVGSHVMQMANLWRISDDFWDTWPALFEQFERCRQWAPFVGPGHWPDADMLPLGTLDMGRRQTRFTRDEQYTLMTLWSICRSPLIMGGDLTRLDAFTLSLLTNDEILAVNQRSTANHGLFNHDGLIAWLADVPGSRDKYLAVFNTRGPAMIPEEAATWRSPLVTRATPGHAVPVDVDLGGARKLWLVVTEGGDDFTADHADWIEPRLTTAGGEVKLSDLDWRKATTGWGAVAKGRSAAGGALSVAGRPASYGIGTHAPSVIEFDLPAGVSRFQAQAALDDGGTRQGRGATVRFLVFTRDPLPAAVPVAIPVRLAELGISGPAQVRDLWAHRELGRFEQEFAPVIPSHGAGCYRVRPLNP